MNRLIGKGGAFVLIGVLLVAALIAGLVFLRPGAASAQAEPSSGEPQGTNATLVCTIAEVAVHSNGDRIHIRCNPGAGAIAFFSAATSPAEILKTNQFLTLANTAYALGKKITIVYETDQTKNPPGCWVGDCRKILGLILTP